MNGAANIPLINAAPVLTKIMNELLEYVNDADLKTAFGNANFGSLSNRDVIKFAILKYASGYATGHTAMLICLELGLITKSSSLTKKGKRYLYFAFSDGSKSP